MSSKTKAIAYAKVKIKERGCDPLKIKGYVYIVGPTVSDLLIVKPCIKIGKTCSPLIRACTDKEWSAYYVTYVI